MAHKIYEQFVPPVIARKASLQIRNEAKQKNNLKKLQAADTSFKQPTHKGLNFQSSNLGKKWYNLQSSNHVTQYFYEIAQCIHMLVKHFWENASNFSDKVQVSAVYLLDTARNGNHIGILFNVNIINNFKNENYFNSYMLKEQLWNYNTGMLSNEQYFYSIWDI